MREYCLSRMMAIYRSCCSPLQSGTHLLSCACTLRKHSALSIMQPLSSVGSYDILKSIHVPHLRRRNYQRRKLRVVAVRVANHQTAPYPPRRKRLRAPRSNASTYGPISSMPWGIMSTQYTVLGLLTLTQPSRYGVILISCPLTECF